MIFFSFCVLRGARGKPFKNHAKITHVCHINDSPTVGISDQLVIKNK